MITPLSRDELLKISSSLEDYHAIFYKFWEMSSVVFDDELGTACVRFFPEEPDRKPEMALDPKFWAGLTHRERLFVVCHECLHVLLDHGLRNGMDVKGATASTVNKAQDITINEMIVDLFGYDREDLREWKAYCWIETCFDDPSKIARNETFTYYLKKLIEQGPKKTSTGAGEPQTLDSHGQPGGPGQPEPGDGKGQPEPGDGKGQSKEEAAAVDALAAQICDELTAEELEAIIGSVEDSGGQQAGKMRGRLERLIGDKRQRAKLNIRKLVLRLKKTSVKYVPTDVETFTAEDRRFSDVLQRKDIALPGKGERDKLVQGRLFTALFMDVSGSCMAYLDTFFKVFAAFDAEKEVFDTRLFVFDTWVTEIKVGDRARVGGGTYFHIIEQKLQELKREVGKYPDCVIVITDGYGDQVVPQIAKRWVWLLTPQPSYGCIPRQSTRYLLSDVTF